MKKLSIITINYNNCNGLKKTIESIVNQTYSDYEYIIIDGGSTDGSVEIIKEYADKIDYWVSEPDKGIYNAMNKGILKSTGEYCNFMNSGDSYHQTDVLENVLQFCNADIVAGKYIKGNMDYPFGHRFDSITMLDFVKGTIPHPASFIKRSLFEDNLYDENYKVISDWKFFIDVLIFKNCSFRNIEIIVTDFDDSGISSTNTELSIFEREKVLKGILLERIYVDYIRFAKADSPLLELTPILNKTDGFNRFIYSLVAFLIRIYSVIRKITHNPL
ncbi:Glycosyltransferase involved in cell wall bisynthesis [Bacteroides luti]|uniref:Glycosyltransferase involved in cell wall bisynthesis n=1 Tax=Bacteroides luti TaxID=1297750 RepID=A0A1M5BFS7_9BACE|nr:glycosyltransferase family 2 protein [Bacteroides luti]SHF41371.1 Glycosyltransferase involved in cell wall bisynthesis [Bacteroides luti]